VVTPAGTFESWTPAEPVAYAARGPVRNVALESRDRAGNAVLGGVIGAAAGVAFCTVVSNIVKDERHGLLHLHDQGLPLTGGVGFVLGFLVGLTV
jgi:hypothetical protein